MDDAERIALCCLVVVFATSYDGGVKANIPTVPDYFPEIQGDLSKVTWAHAVNSRALLEEVMEKGDIMMLEADIVLGSLVNGSDDDDVLPVMGHPPSNISDISLAEFLSTIESGIIKGKRKGVKLDFKTTEVFKASLPVLGEYKNKMTFPVWLNADILQGPINSKRTPVDSDAFLFACRTIFPETTLSVGWTTLYGSDEGSPDSENVPDYLKCYSTDNVMDMLDALRRNSVTQTVTFPVRAGLAAHSLRDLTALLESSGSSLTIWSASSDPVDILALNKLIKTVGRHRVYIDVPESLAKQLSSGSPSLFSVPLLAFGVALLLLICLNCYSF